MKSAAEVEGVVRQGAAHGLRILLKQDRQVAGQLLLHLVPLNEDDVALRQGLLCHFGGDDLILPTSWAASSTLELT